ncbi:MAG: PIN domain-containing protein [Planctomycetes bacterium]|nr:PIN domain-containing protein [Planctomycetota bacterium]
MNFASLPNGALVFLDANTLVYHFSAHAAFGPACAVLLDRIERQELQGFTSSHILGEMAHKLMMIEAQQRFGWPAAGLANRLKRHPHEVKQLSVHQRAIDEVRAIGIHVLPVDGADVSRAADISRQFGLLANDALTVVIMNRYNLTLVASSDADFDRVPGLTRFAPV